LIVDPVKKYVLLLLLLLLLLSAARVMCLLRSPACGHTYGRAAIETLMKGKGRAKQKPSCPIAGCTASLDVKSLQPDEEMKLAVIEYQRKQATKGDDDRQYEHVG
jgi:hypothetical protein